MIGQVGRDGSNRCSVSFTHSLTHSRSQAGSRSGLLQANHLLPVFQSLVHKARFIQYQHDRDACDHNYEPRPHEGYGEEGPVALLGFRVAELEHCRLAAAVPQAGLQSGQAVVILYKVRRRYGSSNTEKHQFSHNTFTYTYTHTYIPSLSALLLSSSAEAPPGPLLTTPATMEMILGMSCSSISCREFSVLRSMRGKAAISDNCRAALYSSRRGKSPSASWKVLRTSSNIYFVDF